MRLMRCQPLRIIEYREYIYLNAAAAELGTNSIGRRVRHILHCGMGFVSWYEICQVRDDTALATFIAIVLKGEAVSVVSAAIAGTFEGGAYIVVIAYEMVKRGFDRGRAQGEAEGRAKERAEARRQNIAYYKRMQEARERGEEFNEPPPMFENDEEQELN